MKPVTIVLGILALLVLSVIGLFGWQNLQTQVDLVLNLGPIGGWYIAKAFPVVYLMAICLGSGFAIAFLWLGGKAMAAGRRAKSFERQVAALQDEIDWARRNTKSPAPAAKKATPAPKPLAPKRPAVPVAAPSKPTPPPAADPPDFDDLI